MVYEDYDGTMKTYFKELKRFSPLDRKTERKLLYRYKKYNDLNARNKLINSNLRYACKLASSYKGKGVLFADLISEANNELINSIDKYNMKYDVKLISYAKWWIMQRLNKTIEERGRMPITEIPVSEKNETVECDVEDFDEDNDSEVNSFENDFTTDTEYEEKEQGIRDFLTAVMSGLDEREKEMVNMYYGRGYSDSFTLEEIGKKFNLTKERVRQIIEIAFKKMRSEAVLCDVDDFMA